MDRSVDPKHLKTLADILALVLVDQPGESMAALEAVRRRAKRDGMTGGVLKDLVLQIVNDAKPGSAPRASSTAQIDQLKAELLDSQRRFVETRLDLERERREADNLRRRLHDVQAPIQRARRTLVEAAHLRVRVAELERQAHRANELQAEVLKLRGIQLSRMKDVIRAPHRWRHAGKWAAFAACFVLIIALASDQIPVAPPVPPAPDGPPIIISV